MKIAKSLHTRRALWSAAMGLSCNAAVLAQFQVTSTADNSAAGTLRYEIAQANAAGSGTVTITASGTITLTSPLPVITFAGTITSTATTTINGNNLYRPFFVDLSSSSQALTISDLTIANGAAIGGNGGMGAGGAIFVNTGAVTLSGVTTQNSKATGGSGGLYSPGEGGGGGGGLGGAGGNAFASKGSAAGGGGGGGLFGAGGVGASNSSNSNNGSGGGGGGEYFAGGNANSGAAGGGGAASSAGQTPTTTSGGAGGTPGGGRGGDDDTSGGSSYNGASGSAVGAGGGGAGSDSIGAGIGGAGQKFGGGGGGYYRGGAGGDFGAGGGGKLAGGNGGFGGGGGGSSEDSAGLAGFGGGNGGAAYLGSGASGGSAYGGAIFVRSSNGASLTIADTSVDAGTLTAGAGDTANNGANGSASGSSLFLYGGTTTLSVASGGTQTIAGSIADDSADGNAGAITKTGSGTLILAGNNTYTGLTTINAGTLQLGSGGTSGSIATNVADNGNLTLDQSGTVTFTTKITGSGSVTQAGTGTLTLSNSNNSYSGGTNVVHGVLDVTGNMLPAGAVAISSGATLQYDTTSANQNQSNVTFTGAGTIKKIGANSLTFAGNGVTKIALSAGALIDVEAGTFDGSSSFQADWSTNQSSLNIASGATFDAVEGGSNDAAQFDALTGTGTLQGGYYTYSTAITLGVANGSGTFSGSIYDDSGPLSIVKTGTGTQTLTGVCSYTGGTTVNQGTLSFTYLPAPSVAIQSGAMVQFSGLDGVNPITFTGGGTLQKTTNSTVDIDGGSVSMSAGGLIDVEGGTLYFASGSTSPYAPTSWSGNNAGLNVASGAKFDAGSAANTIQVDALTGAGSVGGGTANTPYLTITLGIANGSGTFSGVIADDSSSVHLAITKAGTGTEILTGTNTYSGGTTISSGALQLGTGGTTGSVVGSITDNGSLILDRLASVAVSNPISGTGSLTDISSGTIILTATNTYSGGTTISSGTLQVGNNGTGGSITGNVTDNAALVFDRSNTTHFSNNISGTGTFTKSGTGTLTLSGTDTYTGGTTVSSGTLIAGALTAISSSPLAIDTGATLQFANNFHGTLAIPSLTFQSGANLDLGETDLIDNYTGTDPYTTILAAMKSAYDSGKWDLTGIYSSALATGTALGIYDNSNNTKSSFDGISVDSTTVVIKYTWLGDANCDGLVNSTDLSAISASGTTWQTGDFNYDGKVNADDYALFMLGDTEGGGMNISATLPEPRAIIVIIVAGMAWTRQRRWQVWN